MEAKVKFMVGDVPVFGEVVLAPMAGFSDVPNRAICRSFGSAMNYTEFVAAEEILAGTRRAAALLDFTAEDRPMVFQVFGNDARLILEAAQRIEALGPDIIDVNMGCSTRRVSGRGAGVGMMPQPDLVAQTFSLLSGNLSVPVSGKIRLGWEVNRNYLEIARIMADNGAALIAVHPRTKEQQYRGQAHWAAIGEIKQAVNLPVLGSGDVTTPEAINRMLAETGCDGVMIGRAAIGNPWLFAREHKLRVPPQDVHTTMRRHLQSMLDYYGEYGLVLFRKHLKRYLQGFAVPSSLRRKVLTTDHPGTLFELLSKTEAAMMGEYDLLSHQVTLSAAS